VEALVARDLTKTYRNRSAALDGLSLSVADGETLVVLGPSGAGKTTLLRVIAGLLTPDRGTLQIGGRNVLPMPAQCRGVGLVFSNDALFPHMTVFENLAFAMRLRRRTARAIEERVHEVADALEIGRHLHERPPALSGGERQRAAIARAVLSDPRVLLLDEPFAHLDPQLRGALRSRYAAFRRRFAGAMLHVTHDHLEALGLGDRVAILMHGSIVQCDTPQRVYDYPADIRVAAFFGSPPMNILDDRTLGIRPEHVLLDANGALRGRIVSLESTGADRYVGVATQRGRLLARIPAAQAAHVEEEIGVTLPEAFVRRFDPQTGVLVV
jgi:multiple sugar transport system ATP-binding protein